MTAEELASKELAEWREREAKHQLDMIQKTEMEMMSMTNKYLVKTHKGEEIIEDAAKDLALEAERSEAASISLGTDVDANGSSSGGGPLDLLQDTTDRHKSHLFDLNCRICSGQLKEDEVNKESNKTTSKSSHKKASKDNDKKSASKKSHHSSSGSKKTSDKVGDIL